MNAVGNGLNDVRCHFMNGAAVGAPVLCYPPAVPELHTCIL